MIKLNIKNKKQRNRKNACKPNNTTPELILKNKKKPKFFLTTKHSFEKSLRKKRIYCHENNVDNNNNKMS
jgi:hypothetical protein